MIHLDTNFLIQALVPGSAPETTFQTWLTDGEALGHQLHRVERISLRAADA
jgi:hypothetical protein